MQLSCSEQQDQLTFCIIEHDDLIVVSFMFMA